MPAEDLPEGTDAIVTGAGVGADDERDADAIDDAAAAMTVSAPPAGPTDDELPQSVSERIAGLKGQAGDRARTFVDEAKTRAADGIDGFAGMIEDAATEVDARIGTRYGDYIRSAADSVSGVSDALKDKDVDALFEDARAFIQRAPGVAIGAAAALGFVVARLARAGADEAAAAPGAKPKKAA